MGLTALRDKKTYTDKTELNQTKAIYDVNTSLTV